MRHSRLALTTIAAWIAVALACDRRQTEEDYAEAREQLVRETVEARGISSARVLAAMRKVARHGFVPEAARAAAYADRPLSIGWGQTISQPYIVAYMTQAVAPGAQDRCLEIGTGSGYQAAVLAELCAVVFSIEYVPELADFARRNLRAAGYGDDRVKLRVGDGYQGWPEQSPFQVIVVTAAPSRVPQPLLDQLAVGGRLIAPVGPQDDAQWLELWSRQERGFGPKALAREQLLPVRFVPFLGRAARRR